MAQDLEQAQLFEIEWPEGMKMFDTQKLYMAWQLQRLGASAGRKALEQVVLRAAATDGAHKAAPTLEVGHIRGCWMLSGLGWGVAFSPACCTASWHGAHGRWSRRIVGTSLGCTSTHLYQSAARHHH